MTNDMKKTYHLCLSAGNEIMFRDQSDYYRAFNSFALALYKTNSTGLAEAIMATHIHMVVQTSNPTEFMHAFRKSYSKYFNNKYGREGCLGEKNHFQLEINGVHHLIAAISYVLRNPLHHGVATIAYAYPHSSINVIFQEDMGKLPNTHLLSEKSYYKYIGRRAEYPSHYKMSKEGVFLRESVLDIAQVENIFVTPRAFDYYMNRKTSEDWEKEQHKDGVSTLPIKINDIEKGIKLNSIDSMLRNESGRGCHKQISDIELCYKIDHEILPKYGKGSIYLLTVDEQLRIAEFLSKNLHIGEGQIKRCLHII